MTSSESAKDLSKSPTYKRPKLTQLDKVMCKWFTAMPSEGKPSGPIISEKVQSFMMK
jgi:hypothetical protein